MDKKHLANHHPDSGGVLIYSRRPTSASRLLSQLRVADGLRRARGGVVRAPSALDAHYHRSRGDLHGLIELLDYHEPSMPGEAAQVRQAAAAALPDLRDSRAIDGLIHALDDNSPTVQATAAEALGRLASSRSTTGVGLAYGNRARILAALFPLLHERLNNTTMVRIAAAEAIYLIGGEAVIRPLLALARRSSVEFQHWFVRWAGRSQLDTLMIDLYPWADKSVRDQIVEYLRAHLSQAVLKRLEAAGQPCDNDIEALIQRVFE